MKTPHWSALRADFPILDQMVNGFPLLYFDNAATTQKPRQVLDALRHYYERDNSNRPRTAPSSTSSSVRVSAEPTPRQLPDSIAANASR